MKGLSWEMQALYEIVQRASALVQEILNRGVVATVKDAVPGGSHHSVVTEADNRSQEFLLTELRWKFPGVLFLAEEECEGPDIIQNSNLGRIKKPGDVFIIDALDGTAGAYRRRWDWSVCVNLMEDGFHRGGAIFAPDVRGGFSIVGEKGIGAFVRDGDEIIGSVTVSERPRDKSTVLYGVDILRRPQFMKFSNVIANAVQTAVVAGSCALGVATVAAGRAEAIVQSHQWPWDWASATIIEAAGGKVQYYHYRNGHPIPLSEPDLASYNRENRTDQGGLGFIAGAPELVDWLFSQLQENWGR